MKFKFTTTPLKDLPLGTMVDGYKLVARSHTGKNAEGYKEHEGKFVERVLLIYQPEPPIEEVTCPQT